MLLLVAAAIAFLVWQRRRAAPETVRLLPEADAVLYVNLDLIRVGTPVPSIPEVTREADYTAFVRETGFEFERDLDEVALAVHSVPPPPPQPGTPPSGPPPLPYRTSLIFVGRFQSARLSAYLKKLAQSTERYGDSDIYNIPYEARTVRVALLGVDRVAVSNEEDPGVIHGMIDRYHALAGPVGGPGLVREHYGRIPVGSVAWAIGRIPAKRAGAQAGGPPALGMVQQMAGGSTVVASLRYQGSIRFRVEAITASEPEAKQLGENLGMLLALFRGAGTSVRGEGPDPDVKAFFDSIDLRQEQQSVVVTATLPERAIQKVLA
ncbi:MAG: hypothetical protein M3O85_05365, partial [Acidobacteriota bacterium]|nr:hypothetical protein [Acidobacteriota bacterium]